MPKIIVVIGPTGVGKTSLSLKLAKEYNAEIVNADAMQIYKEMNIGTAKIKDTKGIKHHLLSIKSIDDDYSVYEYQKDARKVLNKLLEEDKNVIIVGGTGLYIKALLYDYEFKNEEFSSNYDELSNEEIYNIIKENDIDIHVNNRKRLVRALNKVNNNSITNKNEYKILYDNVYFVALTLDRSVLYERINSRVDDMIKEGLIEEVKGLYDNGKRNIRLNTAIGYKELYKYFDNEISLNDAIELIKRNSRRYAKRQYTWINNKMNVKWFNVDLNNFDNTVLEVIEYIKNNQ